MQKKILYTSLAALIVASVVAGSVYYKNMLIDRAYTTKAKATLNTFAEGDYTGSVEGLHALVADAKNKADEGKFSVFLGAALYKRDQGSDQSDGIKLLKKVATDDTFPPQVRAGALNQISAFVSNGTSAFYAANFSEAFFGTVPTKETEEERILEAYGSVLKLSDGLYPTSFAEYALAANYYGLMATSTKSLAVAEQIFAYVKKGDSRQDRAIYSPSFLFASYYYRAQALYIAGWASGATYTDKTVTIDEIDNAFQKVLSVAIEQQQDVRTSPAFALNLQARFSYALFLSDVRHRDNDARAVLQAFADVDTRNKSDLGIFSKIKTLPKNSFMQRGAVALLKISPEFKKFYDSL